ncbi:phytanoyl-CoA dioxygenase family protein [Francisella sciaenopsi]|uniref:Phytanoyl-CoA dioxygenase family protein n=1 Tax=Francisella sciaenopsi TaxID=3055034 RepID=A0ABQ6PJA1_9GAMM
MKNKKWYDKSFFVIFTRSKNFKSNKYIGSYVLNLCGLHIYRVLITSFFYRVRLFQQFWRVNHNSRKQFIKNGYLIKDVALSDSDRDLIFDLKNQSYNKYSVKEGSTTLTKYRIKKNKIFPLENIEIKNLLKYIHTKNSYPVLSYEEILQSNSINRQKDIQSNWHRDTFHPCTKGWFFLTDVRSNNNGCFEYYQGSHRLTLRRLVWEYKQSLIACGNHNRGYNGAFRIDESCIRKVYPKSKKIVCEVPKETFLCANVFGFHRRGEVPINSVCTERESLWFNGRPYPFTPFVFGRR